MFEAFSQADKAKGTLSGYWQNEEIS